MLTLNDYITVSPYYKLAILSVTDVAATVKDEKYQWDLYVVDSFYVEVRYSVGSMKNDYDFKIKAFDDVKSLERYLDSIDLSKIL